MNLRIVFKFKDCKLQFYEKRRLFCYFSVNPCMPASRWRRLLKLKSKKSLRETTNRASECHSPHRIYNSLLRMRAIHELKRGKKLIYSGLAEKLRFRNESIYLSFGVKVSNIMAVHRKLIHFYLLNESTVEKKQHGIIHLLEPRYNKSYK